MHTYRAERPSGNRDGMTLVEVMISMVILVSVILVLGAFTARFTQASARASTRAMAVELASDRLEYVKSAPTYPALDTMATTEKAPNGLTAFTRQTYVQHVGGGAKDTVDYKIITVSVSAAGLTNPVKKTTVIADF
jgi:Tfp pilus assembly protein PilV